jgi:hypothetical protein
MVLKISVLESAMPTAMNALVLAITYDLDVELVSSVIFVTTVKYINFTVNNKYNSLIIQEVNICQHQWKLYWYQH